jgi:DNA repair protein RadC
VHNHPSCDATPSRADVEMTREVAKALGALEIKLHDHLVVGRGEAVSMKTLGLI